MSYNPFEQPGTGFTLLIVSMFLLGAGLSFMSMTDSFTISPFEQKNYPLLAIQASALIVTSRVVFSYFRGRQDIE